MPLRVSSAVRWCPCQSDAKKHPKSRRTIYRSLPYQRLALVIVEYGHKQRRDGGHGSNGSVLPKSDWCISTSTYDLGMSVHIIKGTMWNSPRRSSAINEHQRTLSTVEYLHSQVVSRSARGTQGRSVTKRAENVQSSIYGHASSTPFPSLQRFRP
jgi:hypothetical protein